MKRTFVLTSLLAFAALSPNDSGYGASPSPDAAGLCAPVRGSFCGEKVPESPDPLVAYQAGNVRWLPTIWSITSCTPCRSRCGRASGKTRSIRARAADPDRRALHPDVRFRTSERRMARIRLRRPGRRSRDEYQRIYRAGRAERPAPSIPSKRPPPSVRTEIPIC